MQLYITCHTDAENQCFINQEFEFCSLEKLWLNHSRKLLSTRCGIVRFLNRPTVCVCYCTRKHLKKNIQIDQLGLRPCIQSFACMYTEDRRKMQQNTDGKCSLFGLFVYGADWVYNKPFMQTNHNNATNNTFFLLLSFTSSNLCKAALRVTCFCDRCDWQRKAGECREVALQVEKKITDQCLIM